MKKAPVFHLLFRLYPQAFEPKVEIGQQVRKGIESLFSFVRSVTLIESESGKVSYYLLNFGNIHDKDVVENRIVWSNKIEVTFLFISFRSGYEHK